MSQLPTRPDLDQLRRQARELYRAALGGDARALRRLRQVSGTVALSAAQPARAHLPVGRRRTVPSETVSSGFYG
jgi:hypothetical protein